MESSRELISGFDMMEINEIVYPIYHFHFTKTLESLWQSQIVLLFQFVFESDCFCCFQYVLVKINCMFLYAYQYKVDLGSEISIDRIWKIQTCYPKLTYFFQQHLKRVWFLSNRHHILNMWQWQCTLCLQQNLIKWIYFIHKLDHETCWLDRITKIFSFKS